jgi:ESCRT-II complex subunit VPS25
MILNYCEVKKTSVLNVGEWPYWENKQISRKLSPEDVQAVINYLLSEQVCEYLDNSKTKLKMYWKTPLEWSEIIYKWVVDSGKMNTIFTVYELHSGIDTYNEPFHGLDSSIVYGAVSMLQSNGRAEVYKGTNLTVDEFGVKFKSA